MRTASPQAFAGATLLLDPSFRQQVRLAWRLLRDERVSPLKYLLPLVATLYLASPVDLLPDLFLGLGQVDDMGIAVAMTVLAVRLMPKFAPREIVAEHAAAMAGAANDHGTRNGGTEAVFDASYHVRG